MVDAVHLRVEDIILEVRVAIAEALVVVAALDVAAEALAEVDHQEIIVKVQENHFLLDVMYQALDILIKMMDALIIHLVMVLADLMEVLHHVNDPLVKPVLLVLLPKNVRELTNEKTQYKYLQKKQKRKKMHNRGGYFGTVEEMHSLYRIYFFSYCIPVL